MTQFAMPKKALFGLSVLLFILVSLTIAFVNAQDNQGITNDPTENERANACYEGGTLEGQCNTLWEWKAGWYLIRFEKGLISREDFPQAFRSILPPEVPPAPPKSTPKPPGGFFTALPGIPKTPTPTSMIKDTPTPTPIPDTPTPTPIEDTPTPTPIEDTPTPTPA